MSAFFATLKQIGALLDPLSRNATILADDVVGLAKPALAAADDIAALSKPALSKASAVVVDDTAVCSDQLSASAIAQHREYAVWGKIVGSSLLNKGVLTGIILAANAVAPAIPQIMLGLGGCYLAFEGAHKVHGMLHKAFVRLCGRVPTQAPPLKEEHITPRKPEKKASYLDRFLGNDPHERRLLTDLILLDAILSTEILLITYGLVGTEPLSIQAGTLGVVGITTTLGVYGAVLCVIRADNVAAYLNNPASRIHLPRLGNGIMHSLPSTLRIIGVIGTIAMLGVGGEVLSHLTPKAVAALSVETGETLHHALAAFSTMLSHLPAGETLAMTLVGLAAGLLLTTTASLISKMKR